MSKNEPFGAKKLSLCLFGLIAMTSIICGSWVSVHFNDPKWFQYGLGGVFTALVLIALFGWPIND